MPKYRVRLNEQRRADYETSVTVEAATSQEAEEKAMSMARREEIDFGIPLWEDVTDTDVIDVEELPSEP